MIPAHPGYAVNFKLEPRPPERAWTHLPVVAWDDDGAPLVAHRRGLITPDRANFGRPIVSWEVTEADTYPHTVPGDGWMVTRTDTTTGDRWTEPVIAWQIDPDGYGRPITLDAEGALNPDPDPSAVVWHPQHRPHPEVTQ